MLCRQADRRGDQGPGLCGLPTVFRLLLRYGGAKPKDGRFYPCLGPLFKRDRWSAADPGAGQSQGCRDQSEPL